MLALQYALCWASSCCINFFFFNDTATTEIYTLSLHDALPICSSRRPRSPSFSTRTRRGRTRACGSPSGSRRTDRKSTRLNSSHVEISYAVFCLKKKKNKKKHHTLIQKKKLQLH